MIGKLQISNKGKQQCHGRSTRSSYGIVHICVIRSKKKKHLHFCKCFMAAEEGFEPSQTDPESVVLPLHNSAISSLLKDNINIIPRKFHLSIGKFQKNGKISSGKCDFITERNRKIGYTILTKQERKLQRCQF